MGYLRLVQNSIFTLSYKRDAIVQMNDLETTLLRCNSVMLDIVFNIMFNPLNASVALI